MNTQPDNEAPQGLELPPDDSPLSLAPEAPAPAVVAPTSEQVPAPFDPKALEERLRQVAGDGWTLDRLVDNVAGLKKYGDTNAQKAAELARRFQPYQPLIEAAERDNSLSALLYEQTRDHYARQGVGQMDPGVAAALDPMQRRIMETEIGLAEFRMEREIQGLKQDPELGAFVTPEMEQEILISARASRDPNPNLRQIFLAQYAPELIRRARESATQDVRNQVKAKHDVYQPVAPSVTAPSPLALESMSPAQREAHDMAEIARMARDPAYAKKVMEAEILPNM